MTQRNIIGVLLFLFTVHSIQAQTNKKFKGKKRTSRRELAKRIREGEERNQADKPFASVQKSSTRGLYRDDMIWKAESGNTIYNRATNISVVEPSRYGIKEDLELQSHLSIDYWIPNVFIKKRWYKSKWYISSRHGFYTSYPGFDYAQNRGMDNIIDSSITVPFVLGIKNELLFSRPFINSYSCTPNQPTWILHFGFGLDYGLPFTDSEMSEVEGHFSANRFATMIDKGHLFYFFVGATKQLGNSIIIDANIKYFNGSFSGEHSIEQKTMAEFFLGNRVSVSAGFKVSYGNYNNSSKIGFIPIADLTWYLGQKQGRKKGLFEKRMR